MRSTFLSRHLCVPCIVTSPLSWDEKAAPGTCLCNEIGLSAREFVRAMASDIGQVAAAGSLWHIVLFLSKPRHFCLGLFLFVAKDVLSSRANLVALCCWMRDVRMAPSLPITVLTEEDKECRS